VLLALTKRILFLLNKKEKKKGGFLMIKFGSFIPQGWRREFAGWEKPGEEFDAIKSVTIECEKLRYDSIWLYDHFITYSEATTEPCFESWTTLSAIASITKKLGLGIMVTCNSFRYPSVLAKISATLDVISKGRLNFGIGAGWYNLEYNAYGIPYPKASVRIAQLGEAVLIIKKMWTEDEPSFKGNYYTIEKQLIVQNPYKSLILPF